MTSKFYYPNKRNKIFPISLSAPVHINLKRQSHEILVFCFREDDREKCVSA